MLRGAGTFRRKRVAEAREVYVEYPAQLADFRQAQTESFHHRRLAILVLRLVPAFSSAAANYPQTESSTHQPHHFEVDLGTIQACTLFLRARRSPMGRQVPGRATNGSGGKDGGHRVLHCLKFADEGKGAAAGERVHLVGLKTQGAR